MTTTLDNPTITDPTTDTDDTGPGAAQRERGSAYPHPVAELLPRARQMAAELGERPSRRRLMRALRIGGPKADAVLAALDTIAPRDTAPATAAPLAPPTPIDLAPPTVATVPEVAPAAAVDGPSTDGPSIPTPVASTSTPVPVSAGGRRVRSWPVWLLALPAFVAIWSGWVGLGELTGFGTVRPLPGVWDSLSLNTAITLPVGMEAYAAFALRVWLSASTPVRARRFARTSAVGALALGAAGQVAYHLMSAAGMTAAPWPITAVVACLPVAVLGMGAALAHLLADHDDTGASDHNTEHEHDDVNRERGEAQR